MPSGVTYNGWAGTTAGTPVASATTSAKPGKATEPPTSQIPGTAQSRVWAAMMAATFSITGRTTGKSLAW